MCALIALGYVTASEKDLAIFLLIVAVGINSSTYLGFQVCNMLINWIDMFFNMQTARAKKAYEIF